MLSSKADFYVKVLAQHSPDLICIVDADHVMRYASAASRTLLGWEPEEMTGLPPHTLLHPEERPVVMAAAVIARESHENVCPPLEIRMRRKDGSYCWLESAASIVRNPQTGELAEVVLIMRDISRRVEERERLHTWSITDALTGLLNRRGFNDVLEKTWEQTLRSGSQMSLLLLDIDHFKQFNDTYGHQFGDDCLRAVAAAVRAALPLASFRAARYGGEELAVVLPDTNSECGLQVAEKLRQSVSALQLPHATAPGGFLSVSIGVATAFARVGGSSRMPESLLLAADNALYQAKREGRNRVSSNKLLASKAE